MRDPWRLDGATKAEELLPLAVDGTALKGLEAARAYSRGEIDDLRLAEVHSEVVTAFERLRASDWARSPLYAAAWLTSPEARWHTNLTPWALVEQAHRNGPPPLRRESASV
jgi:hypothetical protein